MLGRMLGLMLFGGIFLAVGLAVVWFLGAQTTLTCERPEPRTGECTLVSANALGLNTRSQTVRLNEIQRAELQVSEDEDGDETYRVVLRTETGEVPLTGYYSSGRDDKRQNVDRINAFLDDGNARTLTASQDDRLFASIFGGLFACVGGLAVVGGLLAPLGLLRRGVFGH